MIAIISCGHRPDDERIYTREIKSLLKAGHKITYFTRWEKDTNLSEENLWHRNYSEKDLSLKDYTKGILNDFKVLKPKAIHIHEFELLPLASKAKKIFKSKLVYDVHEANIELWDAFSSKPQGLKQMINKVLDQFEKKYLNNVDQVLTVASVLVDRYQKRGIKATLLPNYPLDLPRRSKKSKLKTLIYHGQISLERGLEDLINAVSFLKNSGHSFKLEIYGNERVIGTIDKLKSLINELGLSEIVSIYKQIPHEEMLRILSSAHIAVIPFRDHPMFRIAIPVKLFEAMWAKCAVVASDLESIRTYDEEFIEFYPPGNIEDLSLKLDHLLKNEDEAIRLGEKGAQLIKKKYNWSMVEKYLLETYQGIDS